MDVCTIVARNYLAYARVLAESFREYHPDGNISVLVVDDVRGETSHDEPFQPLGPYDIGLEPLEIHRMAMIYSLVELSTAVKPWLLRTLLDRGATEVMYLDPDILVLAPLDDLADLARRHSIILTPHLTKPLPEDERLITEQTIRLSGTYNLGCIAVSSEARPFLEWWSSRLARHCRIAHAEGEFVDQRHVDLVPGLFEHHVLRDPTVNVAYWNAHARRVEWTGTRYEVNRRPLRFFHFSGFEPKRPWLLSKFQLDRPRVLLSEEPALRRLCGEYAAELERSGYRDLAATEYRFDRLPDATLIDSRMRSLYRDSVLAWEQGKGPEPPDPFDGANPGATLDWLSEPADTTGIPRYLRALYNESPNLQAAFPDLYGDDAVRYVEWSGEYGVVEGWVPPRLAGSEQNIRRAPGAPPAAVGENGVNVAGYLTATHGVGEAARQLVNAFQIGGIPCATVVDPGADGRHGRPSTDSGVARAHYGVNLLCIHAHELQRFRSQTGRGLFEGRHSIWFLWWEVPIVPEWMLASLDLIDEVWVGSEFIRENLARWTSKPISVVPLPIAAPPAPSLSKKELGLPDGFTFLFSFDFLSGGLGRKNPLAVIDAYRRAFNEDEGASLLLKSINGDRLLGDLERLRAAAGGRKDILVIDRCLNPRMKTELTSACDCYVSLHRSEGLGLPLAEAMALGKPTIATRFGGNLEYMNDENSYLVPYEPTFVGNDGGGIYPAEATWAEPDLASASALMRYVFEHQDQARAQGERGRSHILEHHSPLRVAGIVSARLEEIWMRQQRNGRMADPPAEITASEPCPEEPAPATAEAGALQRSVAWLERGPANAWTSPSRFGPIGTRLARPFLRRALRPYHVRQREFEIAIVDVLKELNHRLHALTLEEHAHQHDGLGRDRTLREHVESLWQALHSRDDERLSANETRQGGQVSAAVLHAEIDALQRKVETFSASEERPQRNGGVPQAGSRGDAPRRTPRARR